MQRNACPACGTRLSYWREQYQQSWRLSKVNRPISCPACGTTLHWSIGSWRWVQQALFVTGILLITYLLFAKRDREEAQWTVLLFCLSAAAVRILLAVFATRLVTVDEE